MDCVVNKLTFSNVHAGMRNVVRRAPEEEKISGAQVFTVDGRYSCPRSLEIGITRHVDSAAAHQHLRETGAVIAQAGAPTPRDR